MRNRSVLFRLSGSGMRMLGIAFMAGALLLTGPVGCRSKKKLAEEQARAEAEARMREQQERINALKAELETLMATPVRDLADLEARERRLAEIKALNIGDTSVQVLIRKAETFLSQERARLEAAARPQPQPEAPDPAVKLKADLEQAFSRIASASSVEQANQAIAQAQALFASSETPVLIVISQSGEIKDYDRPTTAGRYLNYLKDQRRNPNKVGSVLLDASGKIRELELVKP
ncbi:MAG: hypothetical protein NW241_23285 [Bacteroidia bacterium]|nr:hypothetical protein [Bacteroidia bacterium]